MHFPLRLALRNLAQNEVPEDHVWFEDRWMVTSFCDE
jgi:hypothetical protein